MRKSAIAFFQASENKLIVLLNTGLIIGSAALLIVGYKFVTLRESYPNPAFYIFLFILVSGALGGLYFCFRPAGSKINFILSAVSTLIALYLIEVGLQSYQFLKLGDVAFDSKPASQIIEDFRTKGRELWSYEIPPFHIQQAYADQGKIYALSSPSNVNIITCNETGQWNVLTTDQHGFNNPPIQDNGGVTEVALIGDSFTHGGCTPDNKNIGFYMRKFGVSVRNLGVMGSGPLHQLAVLSEYGKIFRPKYVMWLYYEGNDLGDLLNESNFIMLNKYKLIDHSMHLSEKQGAIDKYLLDYQTAKLKHMEDWRPDQDLGIFKKIMKLESVRRISGLMGYQIDAHRINVNFSRVQSEFADVAKAMKLNAESWGGKLIFVYIPDGTRYDRFQRFEYWKRDIVQIINNLDIPVWDYFNNLSKDVDPLASYNLRRPAHLSAHGNERLANYLNSKMK